MQPLLKRIQIHVRPSLHPGNLLIWSLLMAYAFFCYLQIRIAMQYVSLDTDIAFLRIKQQYVSIPYYLPAFYIHVFTSLFILPAGLTQFIKFIRIHHPKVHRVNGWIFVLTVLAAAGPSGFIIGIYANGGWMSQVAFCLLAVLWMHFTLMAVRTARARKFQAHRKWMIRSFALACSAITLRAWKYILVMAFHPRPMDVYKIIAWLGWVLNLIIAEIIILKTIKK